MANILIVEDSYLTQRLLRLMLERIRHSAICMPNGREALDYLYSHPVDLIITDINMPEMDGWMLLDQLFLDERIKHIPVIVMTASGQENLHRDASRKGAVGFLTQPFSSWELERIVTDCLESAIRQKEWRPQ